MVSFLKNIVSRYLCDFLARDQKIFEVGEIKKYDEQTG